MQEVFEKIIKKVKENAYMVVQKNNSKELGMTLCGFEQVINEVSAEYNNGWTPCSVVMPPVETEVLIITKRKYKGGDCSFIITTAMYEDGTVLENDSCWNWEDIEGEWDEKNDCYIIPEGWWENRHYNPDDVYNNVVDDEVIAWQPLPKPYQPKGE